MKKMRVNKGNKKMSVDKKNVWKDEEDK